MTALTGQLYIGGQWVDGEGEALRSVSPSNGETVWQGKAASKAQVELAVAQAQNNYGRWSQMPLQSRVEICARFAELVGERKEELARLIASENGKTLWDARTEAGAVVGKLKFSLQAQGERAGEKHSEMAGATASLRHRPHGVMAVYGPYNFPAHLPNGHITPALLAGNTVVFKPSEQTPAVAEWMVRVWEEAGIPAGVLSLVQGEAPVGIALADAEINGLLFTGSSPTGKLLHEQLGGRPDVLLALELGGNNPLVVCGAQDVKATAYEIIQSAYISAGQRCTCARRLIVVEDAQTSVLLERLAEMARQLKVGDPLAEEQPFMGPLVSNKEAQRLLDAQQMLLDKGAKPLVKMERLDDDLPYVSAGLLDVSEVAERPDEEYFGPLLQVIRVSTFEEAIIEANNTQYGLSAGLLSAEREKYDLFVQRVHAGIINWNRQTTGASGSAPFGGVGLSGNHHPAGYYAADYCAFPVASVECDALALPEAIAPGVSV